MSYSYARHRVYELWGRVRMYGLCSVQISTKVFKHSSVCVLGGLGHKWQTVHIARGAVHDCERIALARGPDGFWRTGHNMVSIDRSTELLR